MTACGVATVQIARLLLGSRVAKEWRAEDQELAHRAVVDGCAWLDANWNPSRNPGKKSINLYHVLYALHVTDALDLVGAGRLGSRDWYGEMASALLESQKEAGYWNTASSHRPEDVLDTCFALLFFARPFSAPKGDAPAPK
jgi:hypothetical protein